MEFRESIYNLGGIVVNEHGVVKYYTPSQMTAMQGLDDLQKQMMLRSALSQDINFNY